MELENVAMTNALQLEAADVAPVVMECFSDPDFLKAAMIWRSNDVFTSGGATPGRARSNDLAGRSTALAPPCLLLCSGNSVNRK